MPTSHQEPLGSAVQAAMDRMLEGKRFVFLGEPEHCVIEKYPFRLTFIRYLFERGWRHVAMETGRSVGWRVDRYLETGDESFLHVQSSNPQDAAVHDKILEFIDAHEPPFHEQLRRISESREKGTPRMRYWGYDLDLGVPLGSIGPIQSLLEGRTEDRVRELLTSIEGLGTLSTGEQLARVEAILSSLAIRADGPADESLGALPSWLNLLRDSLAAESRPRMNEDPRAHRRWRIQRERLMMQYLDEIVDGLGPDGRLILMGHNCHLSKDPANLHFRPQWSRFWGFRSYLRAWAYEAFSRLTRCPLGGGIEEGSVGSHLHKRFPKHVLSVWMLYGRGTLMMPAGPRTVRIHGDTIESLLAQVGDRFLLPLQDADAQARMLLANANLRLAWGQYASADLGAQADAICFVKDVDAE